MIDLDGMISIPYLKKTTFTGSYKKMRYLIKKVSVEDGDKICTIAWPGPLNFESTDEEKKVSHESEFTKDGIKMAVQWLNEYYEEKFAGESENQEE